MVRFVELSYPLRPDAPTWPGNPPALAIEARDAIEAGDVANTTVLHLFSHSGTHVDTPWHFNPAGQRAAEIPIERYVFDAPALISIPAGEDEFIRAADLEPHAGAIDGRDLVCLLTGWGSLRSVEPSRYASRGPLLHPDGARYLVDRFPALRAIATDAISIGSPRHPDESRETHRILMGFGRTDGRYILIYEDVRLDPAVAGARRVYAWPLMAEGADGTPCTIVAELATND